MMRINTLFMIKLSSLVSMIDGKVVYGTRAHANVLSTMDIQIRMTMTKIGMM